MKVTDNEVQLLIQELDKEQQGMINYKEFLKYSYLSHMFIMQIALEGELNQADSDNKGLVTVEQLDQILQSRTDF